MNHHSFELGKKQTQNDRDHKAHNTKRCILIVLSISMLIFLLILFTTVRIASADPIVKTADATNITDTDATLNGYVNPDGQDTEWWFYWWLNSEDWKTFSCYPGNHVMSGAGVFGALPVACPLKRLQPSTTYTFQLIARWTDRGDGIPGAAQFADQFSFTTLTTIYTMSITMFTITESSTTSTTSQTTAAPPTTHLPPPTPFDFTMMVSPGSVSVTQGGTAHYAVQVQYSDPSYYGTMINLQLTGLGPGMNWQVTQTGDLTVTTTSASPTGTYMISLTGSANGVTHQTGATLIVTSEQPTSTAVATTIVTTPPATTSTTSGTAFDYSVTVSPSTQTVEIGGTASYVVSVLPMSGSPVSVSLTVTGCPGDVRSSFTTPSGNPPYTSTLNLDLSTSSANAGAYTLTVVAAAPGNTKTTTAILMIKEKAAQTTFVQTTTGGLSEALQQNSLLIIAALAVLLILFAVLAMRGRGRRAAPQQMGPSRIYCGKCGTGNPIGNEFCSQCGNKLA